MEIQGQSGSAIVPMHQGRNAHQWYQISAFLSGMPERSAASGKRSAASAAAEVSAVPDGNHGDNRTPL